MGSPAGMRDAGLATDALLIRKLAEFRNAPCSTQPMQAAVVERDSGRIVAAVFQAPQTLKQSGNNVVC